MVNRKEWFEKNKESLRGIPSQVVYDYDFEKNEWNEICFNEAALEFQYLSGMGVQ